MIIVLLVLILGGLVLVLREPPMTDDDYELYFRTNVMGMTKSTLLSLETMQVLQASAEQARLQEKKLCNDLARECMSNNANGR
jgi:hypothetical protein